MTRRNATMHARLLTTAIVVAWVVATMAWIMVARASGGERVKFGLDPSAMRAELGHAFEIDLDFQGLRWWWAARGDSLAAGELSDLVLQDSRGLLGPAHARHPEIRELGGGRYSHWHTRLIFSTRDGSDPRTNGESYEGVCTLGPAAWLEWMATVSLLAAILLSWWRFVAPSERRGRIGFFIVAAGVVLAWNGVISSFVPSWIAVQEDSMSYLNGDSMRTSGYPFFLRTVIAVDGDLSPLARLQVNALVLSIMALSASVAFVLGRASVGVGPATDGGGGEVDARASALRHDGAIEPMWGAGVIALLIMGTAGRIFETTFTVMADGPYIALSCFAAALMGVLARRASISAAIVVGAIVGAAVLVRPIGLAFMPVLLLPWWWHRRWTMLPAAVAPAVVMLLLVAASNWVQRGFFGLSTMGPISLAGHVAWMISPATVPSEPEIAARVERRLAPVLARRPALQWPLGYFLYTSDEYNELLYRNLLPEVDAWIAERRPAPAGGSSIAIVTARAEERDRVLRTLGIEPVLHQPVAYATHVMANIVGAWHWFGRAAPIAPAIARAVGPGIECLGRLEPGERRLFSAWIEAPSPDRTWQRALPWERLRYPIDARPRVAALLGIGATIFGVALIPFSRARRKGRDRDTVAAERCLGALALMAWASIVLIALSATVIFRYVDAIDPLVTASVVLAAVTAWRWLRGRAAASSTPARPDAAATSRS